MTLSVGVNLLWMVHGEVGGSETYTLSHLRALLDHTDVELTLYARPGFATRHADLASRTGRTDRVEIVTAPYGGSSRSARVALETTWLAARSRGRHDAMLHPGGTVPLWSRGSAMVIHDLQWVAYPQYFSAKKRAYLTAMVARSARAAGVVIVNSGFVEATVTDRYPHTVGRTIVVPPAVAVAAGQDHRGDPDRWAEKDAAVLARLGIVAPFVVYPAITYPHKNHMVLVRALSRLAHRPEIAVVLTGGSWTMEADIAAEASRLGVTDRVHRPGRVSEEDLEVLYRRAAGVVFPSRYEGFGMGVVEAMARGCPVVAARATALPETVGEAGLLVDPDDVDGWAAAVELVVDDDTLRAGLIEAGRRRVASFAPEVVAPRLLVALERAAGQAGPLR